MIYQGRELANDFEFMYGEGSVDEFSIFANILEQDEYFVTVARYQNYGKLRISDTTLSKTEFYESYTPISEDPPKELAGTKRTVQLEY